MWDGVPVFKPLITCKRGQWIWPTGGGDEEAREDSANLEKLIVQLYDLLLEGLGARLLGERGLVHVRQGRR